MTALYAESLQSNTLDLHTAQIDVIVNFDNILIKRSTSVLQFSKLIFLCRKNACCSVFVPKTVQYSCSLTAKYQVGSQLTAVRQLL